VDEKPWHATFLAELEASGNVSSSGRRAGVPRRTLYNHRARTPEFRKEWDQALEAATDALEQEARRRALEGWDEPVFQGGAEVGRIRRYDTRMLIYLLQAHRPEKFRDHAAVQHPGGPTSIRVEYPPDWPDRPRTTDHGPGTT
jgi:hypothetical protein